jgi:hypothetical protein
VGETDSIYGTHVGEEKCVQSLYGNLKEYHIQEDTVVDESITLKGPLKEFGIVV